MRLGVVGKNVENQLGAVENLGAGRLFEVSGLGRREIVVEDDRVGTGHAGQGSEFFDLALAEIGSRRERPATLGQVAHDLDPGRLGEPLQLIELRLVTVLLGG
jgi:hypothetical protein